MKAKKLNRLIKSLFGPGEFCLLSFDLLKIMPWNKAILLSYLNNHRQSVKVPPDGEFYCSWKQIEEDLNCKRLRQERMFRDLREAGYITTRKEKRLNPRRMIKIEYLRIIQDVESFLDSRDL